MSPGSEGEVWSRLTSCATGFWKAGEGWLEQQAGASGPAGPVGGGLGPGHSHEREEQARDGASFLIELGVPGLQDSPGARANRSSFCELLPCPVLGAPGSGLVPCSVT